MVSGGKCLKKMSNNFHALHPTWHVTSDHNRCQFLTKYLVIQNNHLTYLINGGWHRYFWINKAFATFIETIFSSDKVRCQTMTVTLDTYIVYWVCQMLPIFSYIRAFYISPGLAPLVSPGFPMLTLLSIVVVLPVPSLTQVTLWPKVFLEAQVTLGQWFIFSYRPMCHFCFELFPFDKTILTMKSASNLMFVRVLY